MYKNFNDFILSINFDINPFNVGKNHERAFIVHLNYKDWITKNFTYSDQFISRVEFERIIDELMLNDFSGQERQDYQSLKKLPSNEYLISLLSIYKLYLIVKVRVRQIGNNDLVINEILTKLTKIFSPIDWGEKAKKAIEMDRELPEINKNENTGSVILPFSLSVLGMSLSKIFSSSTFLIILQIFIFLIVTALLAKLIKNQKSDRDVEELKTWDYIVRDI